MYTKWIYPKVNVGDSHKRPTMPESFIKIHEVSLSWDLASDNDDDRAEYWEDLDGTMTLEQVELEVYGPDGKQAWMDAQPTIAY